MDRFILTDIYNRDMIKNKDLCRLLFELSHEDRLNILTTLKKQSYKFTELCKEVDIEDSEVSRHLKRLLKAELIEKHKEGRYSLTCLGKLAISSLDTFEFITLHKEFVSTHDFSVIPKKFRNKIGELSVSREISGMFYILDKTFQMISDATDFMFVLTGPYYEKGTRRIIGKAIENIKIRYIMEKKEVSKRKREILLNTLKIPSSDFEVRILKNVEWWIFVNEKEGLIMLPNSSGKLDNSNVLISEDITFRRWCEETFDYYWKKAEKFF